MNSLFLSDVQDSQKALYDLLSHYLVKDSDEVKLSHDFENRLAAIKPVLDKIKRVILSGVWSSLNAARLGSQFINNYAMLPAQVVPPKELLEIDVSDALVVVLSESGQTGDIKESVKRLYERNPRGCTVVALTEYENSFLATTVRENGGAVLPLFRGADRNNTSTKGFMNEVFALILLSVYLTLFHPSSRAQTNHLRDRELATTLKSLSDVPAMLARMPQQENEVVAFAQKVAELFSSSPVGKPVMPNAALMLIAPPNLQPLLEEFRCKLIEHVRVPVTTHASWDLKYGPVTLLEPDNLVPAIVLLDIDDEVEVRTLRESLGVAWSRIDPQSRQVMIEQVSRRLFYIVVVSDPNANWRVPLGWASLSEHNTVVLTSSLTRASKIAVIIAFMWRFVYHFAEAIGRDPDDVHIEKVYKEGALFPEIRTETPERPENHYLLGPSGQYWKRKAHLTAWEWSLKIGGFFALLALVFAIYGSSWILDLESASIFITIYSGWFAVLTYFFKRRSKRLAREFGLGRTREAEGR